MAKKLQNTRAFELDVLRGAAVIMMMLHHFIYDLRFIFGPGCLRLAGVRFFLTIGVRAPFVFIFLFRIRYLLFLLQEQFFFALPKTAVVAALFSACVLGRQHPCSKARCMSFSMCCIC